MNIAAYISFLEFAEKLKSVLRHSSTSTGRRESVAEHTWMLCLMTIALWDELSVDADLLKTLKLLIVHDLPEAVTGDIPTFDKVKIEAAAREAERAALQELTAALPPKLSAEIIDLWHEFEERTTAEAQVAYALDKMEALLQHNFADVSSWDAQDLRYQTDFFSSRHQAMQATPFLRELKHQIDLQTMRKLEAVGKLNDVSPEALEWYKRQGT